jgi:thiamine pyrophosphate-dependent acetolactate synthase large subunit-like protein
MHSAAFSPLTRIKRRWSSRPGSKRAPYFPSSRFCTPNRPHLDFCALAEGQGVKSLRVDRCEDLDAALREIFIALEPMLLEVLVE